jgi:RNA polymerase sigma factor (sigma-70 family)
MSESQLDRLACSVRQLAGALVAKDTSDADLLERFTAAGDSAALAALVERHAGLVWSVCARVLARPEDAEDAFQATFLVLLRKAGSVRKRGAVASWLYGVARRTAVHMRRSAARRARAPGQPAGREPEQPVAAAALRELQELLDQEVQRLPETYRAPFVLCVLEARNRAEAARLLGWKEGTVAGRLARGRELLRQRLARRGVALSAALCAGAVIGRAPASAAPAALVASVTGGVLRGTAGRATFGSASALTLSREVQQSMATRALPSVTLCLSALLLAAGTAGVVHRVGGRIAPAAATRLDTEAPDPPAPARSTNAVAVDRYGDPLPAGVLSRLGTARFRHGNNITAVAFAPDGKTIATVGLDAAVHLWDTATGAERGSFRPPDGAPFWSVAYAPDGRTVAAGDHKGRIWLCDGATARQTLMLKAHHDPVSALHFSPNGRTLASGDVEGSIALWETSGGLELRRFPAHGVLGVSALTFAPDGRVLASAGGDWAIRLWDPSTGKELACLGKTDVIVALAFSPDAKLLASGMADGVAHLWDLTTRKEVRRIQVEGTVASGVAFTPDGKRLAVASRNNASPQQCRGGIELFDARTGQFVRRFAGRRHNFDAVALSPDGAKLAGIGGYDSTLYLWDAATGVEVRPAIGHQAPVRYVAVAADNRTVATAAADDTVRLWDALTGEQRHQVEGCRAWFSPDGGTLITVVSGQPSTLRASDARTGRERFRRPLPACDPYGVMTLSVDGRTLAFEGTEHDICLWDVASGKEQGRLTGDGSRVLELTFSPDGARLASGSEREYSVRLWDVAGRREIRRFAAWPGSFTAWPGASAFSPDGNLLAKGKDDGVYVWDVTSGEEVYRLANDDTFWANSCNVGFSPDGRTLAVGSHQLLLWETATRRLRHRSDGFAGRFGTPVFSPDGRLLVAGSTDTTALVWDLRSGTGAEGAPSPAVLNALWDDLASEDAGRAYQAVRRLSAAATQSVPFLRGHLRPVSKVQPAEVAELIAELDSDRFATREKATNQLAQLGEAAVPALRKALAGSPSPEVRRRAEPLLEKWTNMLPAGDRLQALRAVEVLEHAGTPDARRALQAIAAGEPSARLAREARASLDRLENRTPSGPTERRQKQNGEAAGKTP